MCVVCSGGSGLTPTEQFLAQVCNPQNARFNGNAFSSSLLQNSGGKTDTALICCVACLDSVCYIQTPALYLNFKCDFFVVM